MQARSPAHPHGHGQGTRTPRYRVEDILDQRFEAFWLVDGRYDKWTWVDGEMEARMRCAALNAEHDGGNVTLPPHL